jgi:hypothetical protein
MSVTNIHEDFKRKGEVKGASDRSFGIVFALFFGLVAFWPLWHARPVRWWSAGLSGLFLVVTLFRSSLLHPLNPRCRVESHRLADRDWCIVLRCSHTDFDPVPLAR